MYGNFFSALCWWSYNNSTSSNSTTSADCPPPPPPVVNETVGNVTQWTYEFSSGYIINSDMVCRLFGALCIIVSYVLLRRERAKHIIRANTRQWFETRVPAKDSIHTFMDASAGPLSYYCKNAGSSATVSNLKPRCMTEPRSKSDQAWEWVVSWLVGTTGTVLLFGLAMFSLYSAMLLLEQRVPETKAKVFPDAMAFLGAVVTRPLKANAEAEGWKFIASLVFHGFCELAGIDPSYGVAGLSLTGLGVGWQIISRVKAVFSFAKALVQNFLAKRRAQRLNSML